ncbi:rRNA maturation RNase YbeY [Kingella negevensis]|uniref:Endoribonuclease YbeY n=1 Tax=Kingella negevensis TaxID=1522312 RepID=A0A238HI30_9NEIS|nr:rRNA maturation RNase YbeY [Kingella negevensis]MDK4680889.1 rRNA maturation RNase YbeY [Kingella negevensis]MDK4681388.1 rRNA maturation RNase YbeY [Kingella negevensis]MDK4684024.1 rRNA maturation RNase YbeY [Kingella negevensis]MDK4691775.1 rRNA maturation RNase YbeY [Kingella negevensis]MDK4693072.1 rRNA maturation RNase YbeY [Kingella negevensis]
MKKQTKHFPFLRVQQQRFQLAYINDSSATDTPTEKQFYQWIWHALKNFYRYAEISLVLLDEEAARQYNHDYRGKDYATNVLSFAHNEGEFSYAEQEDTLRGDLIICPQVVAKEAAEQGKSLHDHFAHLVIHGTLHLIGFDHIEDEEAEEMEALETKLLAQLNIADPYAA